MLSVHRTMVLCLSWAILSRYQQLLIVWADQRSERFLSPSIQTCLSWSAAPRCCWFDLTMERPTKTRNQTAISGRPQRRSPHGSEVQGFYAPAASESASETSRAAFEAAVTLRTRRERTATN